MSKQAIITVVLSLVLTATAYAQPLRKGPATPPDLIPSFSAETVDKMCTYMWHITSGAARSRRMGLPQERAEAFLRDYLAQFAAAPEHAWVTAPHVQDKLQSL